MKKLLGIITLFLLVTTSFANAASFVNAGFESGDTTGWSSAGNLSAVGTTTIPAGPNIWQVTPFETHMGMLSTSLSAPSVSTLDSAIGVPPGTIAGIIPGAVNGSIAWQDVTLTGPSDIITEYWAFVTTEMAVNDSAFTFLRDLTLPSLSLFVLSSVMDNPPHPLYPVGGYGATSWHLGGWTGAAADIYRVGFGVVNVSNSEVDSYLFLDNGRGTVQNTVPEPATMLLLGSGLIGLWGARKKFKK